MANQEEEADQIQRELMAEEEQSLAEEAAAQQPHLGEVGLAAWLTANAPWWGISLALHVLAILLAGLATWSIQDEVSGSDTVVETKLERRPDIAADKKPEIKIDPLEKVMPKDDPTAEANNRIPANMTPEIGDRTIINDPEPQAPDAFATADASALNSGPVGDGPIGGNMIAGGQGGGDAMEQLIGVGAGTPTRGFGWGLGEGSGYGTGTGTGGTGRGGWGNRSQMGRRYMVKAEGGSKATETAVDMALKWLADNQESDGHWDTKKHESGTKSDTAITGLALLAFVGAGHTETVGPYKGNVRRAIEWLRSQQDSSGMIHDKTDGGNGPGYSHAIAGLALAEAAGMAHIPATVETAQHAVDCSLKDFCNGTDGWRYTPKSGGDLSVTGWFVMQIKSAMGAKLKVEPGTKEKIMGFIDKYEIKDHFGSGGSSYSYTPGGGKHTQATPAIGNLCRLFMGWKPDQMKSAVEGFVEKNGVPEWDKNCSLYYWYYGGLCTFQQGGNVWKSWNEAMKKALLENQAKDGADRGSWPPKGTWSQHYGRVGQTAFGALCLEVYYRYSPMSR